VAQLKPGYLSSDSDVVDAIGRSIGHVRKLSPQHAHALFSLVDGTQRIYLWFPTQKSMALLVLRTQITAGAAEALARGLIDYGDGKDLDDAALAAAFAGAPSSTPTPEKSP
jgi:hypothetical protein